MRDDPQRIEQKSSSISIPDELMINQGCENTSYKTDHGLDTKSMVQINQDKKNSSSSTLNPCQITSNNELLRPSSRNEPDSPPTVLLVDDNPFNLIFAKAILEKLGCKILTAYHGKEAIEVVENHHESIAFILMDCQMPVMDGFEATQILKEKMKQGKIKTFPIYALSANDIEQERDRVEQSKMDGYIRTPLNEAHIMKMLRKT